MALALALLSGAGIALFAGGRPVARPAVAFCSSRVALADQDATRDASGTSWKEYARQREAGQLQGGSIDQAKADIQVFIDSGGDMEFDGGDSGGGVVGDGNTDLEDQHNSATLGALRGGIADLSAASQEVGRGRVKSAVDARTASAGKNYFGRSTGYADKKIEEITEDDLKTGRLDCVRAQQLENWFNQRAIHKVNKEQGQGVVHGAAPTSGQNVYIARDFMAQGVHRDGVQDGEISQADLATHLQELAKVPAQRLDGEEWGAITLDPAMPPTATYELRASPRNVAVQELDVKNSYNTFAPYRCVFTAGSSPLFSATPNAGTMNRRSGEPVHVIVRFSPTELVAGAEATLVFETEDFQHVYRFIGST
uniref:MSP domain-containing protein n=1 Tax=Emiliania huxleyi TaxID=2903 RepID=A0A7S3S7A6_EMIHU